MSAGSNLLQAMASRAMEIVIDEQAEKIANLERLVRLADAMTRDPDAIPRFTAAYAEYLTDNAMSEASGITPSSTDGEEKK